MTNVKTDFMKGVYKRPVFWLACLAGLSYSSWPLAYVLNPNVGHHQLASQLEAPHQPFNWLFIATDILTGLLIAIIGALQTNKRQKRLSVNISIIGYVLFGILVALAAALPLNCDPATNSCGPLIRDPVILVHGISSILSVLLLLLSIILLRPLIQELRIGKVQMLFACTVGCWVIFGAGALIELIFRITGNTLQYYFITVCGASIIFVIGTIEYAHLHEQHKLTHATTKNEPPNS